MSFSPQSADKISDSIEFAPGSVFNSKAEIRQAFANPRYRQDEIYRKMVDDKLERTSKVYSLTDADAEGRLLAPLLLSHKEEGFTHNATEGNFHTQAHHAHDSAARPRHRQGRCSNAQRAALDNL